MKIVIIFFALFATPASAATLLSAINCTLGNEVIYTAESGTMPSSKFKFRSTEFGSNELKLSAPLIHGIHYFIVDTSDSPLSVRDLCLKLTILPTRPNFVTDALALEKCGVLLDASNPHFVENGLNSELLFDQVWDTNIDGIQELGTFLDAHTKSTIEGVEPLLPPAFYMCTEN